MDEQHISLAEFVKQLTARIDQRELPMPLKDENHGTCFFIV
jgi:hypothetical protein